MVRSLRGLLRGGVVLPWRMTSNHTPSSAAMVSVACNKLIRVDFVAAGDLLNWVLAKRGENRSVTFADAHRLAAGMVLFALVVLVTLYAVNRPAAQHGAPAP